MSDSDSEGTQLETAQTICLKAHQAAGLRPLPADSYSEEYALEVRERQVSLDMSVREVAWCSRVKYLRHILLRTVASARLLATNLR